MDNKILQEQVDGVSYKHSKYFLVWSIKRNKRNSLAV